MATGNTPKRGQAAARQKAVAFRAAQRARERRRRLLMWGGIAAAVVVVVGVGIGASLASGSGSGSPPGGGRGSSMSAGSTSSGSGPEGIVLEQGTLLAPVPSSVTGQPVDGVKCEASEQVAYHIHTHLAVYVNGQLRPVPAGIGIVDPVPQQAPNGVFDQASRCYYWLHVHAQDGIIHVESPTRATYTLGQFFAVWHQPLSHDQVGPARGTVTAYVDGKPFSGDPATIPIEEHEVVQLDVGAPAVAPKAVDWSHAQL